VIQKNSRLSCGGDILETEGVLRVLDMAVMGLPKGASPVHHSDRGCQYCSHRYVERLQARGLGIRRLEELHAHAERLNGILKQEYGLGCSFGRKKQALEAIAEGVFLYNTNRPHLSLNYETHENMHRKVV
jgi:transposase InsO family protein